MSPEPQLQLFDAPVLFVEARYRERTLCAHVLSSHAPRGFTVGRGRRADAPIDPRFLPAGLPANDNHTLIAPSGGGFVVNLSPAMREHAQRSATRIRIPCGEVVFDITADAPPPPVPRTWWRVGGDDARITGGVALGLLALLLLVRAVPSDPHALSLDDVGKTIRFDLARVIPPAVVEPPVPKTDRGPAAGGGSPKLASGGPMGQAGDPKAPHRDTRRATKGPATDQDAHDPRAYIEKNSLLSILGAQRSAAVNAVFARTTALGSDADNVIGQLYATNIGESWGAHGLGPIGTGEGAGGTGEAMIGGNGRGLRTIGLGHGGPNGYGLNDHGGGSLGPKARHEIAVQIGQVVSRGNLDKEIIRRVVRQHLNEVRFCYEGALARKPTLAGRVVAQFTIAPTGKVLASALQSSTLGEVKVESCIVEATRRWLYPAPEGGGLVSVTYPFQLAPAGG